MLDALSEFGIKELGDGPYYGRKYIEKRKFSIFKDVKSAFNPKIIIEVGSWEGASTISWAECAEKVICIDTWLGSIEHYENSMMFTDESQMFKVELDGTEWSRDRLMKQDGYPSIFKTFADNIRKNKLQNKVIPITIDCNQGYKILAKSGIKADIVYIDAAHDYDAVMNDLVNCYHLLNDMGHLCGDDYGADVRKAVDDFCRINRFRLVSKENQFIVFDRQDMSIIKFLNWGWKESLY
jgi:hypothetical protein